MEVSWPTVVTSVLGSILVSFVSVRYLTGTRVRAEASAAAMRAIRDFVSPMEKDLRMFRAGMAPQLSRTATDAEDGVRVAQLYFLSHDLSPLRRRLVRQRAHRVFGRGWASLASLHDSTVEREQFEYASHAMGFWLLHQRKSNSGFTFADGLMQQAYAAGPASVEAERLQRELRHLARGW